MPSLQGTLHGDICHIKGGKQSSSKRGPQEVVQGMGWQALGWCLGRNLENPCPVLHGGPAHMGTPHHSSGLARWLPSLCVMSPSQYAFIYKSTWKSTECCLNGMWKKGIYRRREVALKSREPGMEWDSLPRLKYCEKCIFHRIALCYLSHIIRGRGGG